MNSTTRAVSNGSVAGSIATLLMTIFMRVTQLTGLYHDELPPTKVTRAALDVTETEQHVSPEGETMLTGITHWLFGMVCGAIFGVLHRLLRSVLPAPLHGIIFGLLVWAVSYMGWVPAAGILPQPWNQPGAHGLMPMLAHVVYGGTLGQAFDMLERR